MKNKYYRLQFSNKGIDYLYLYTELEYACIFIKMMEMIIGTTLKITLDIVYMTEDDYMAHVHKIEQEVAEKYKKFDDTARQN